jgi:hypothetical protein
MRIVSRVFPSSPAKEGPFSGRGWTPFRGQALIEGFTTGMLNALPDIQSAAQLVARTVSEQLPNSALVASEVTSSLTTGAQTAQRISSLMATDAQLNRTATGIAQPEEAPTPSVEPVPPTVKVYIGERELQTMVVEVIDETNGRLKRAVTSRARRTL